jgi:hypothetical protein
VHALAEIGLTAAMVPDRYRPRPRFGTGPEQRSPWNSSMVARAMSLV